MSATREPIPGRYPGASNSILEQIGNTPLLRFTNIGKEFDRVEIYGKAEWFNPGGSVKDRPALRMIEKGQRSGALTRDKIILDSTSGNTGIAYALTGAVLGYRVELAVPRSVSRERKRMLEAYGAHVIYTDPLEGSDGAIREAHRRYEADPEKYFMQDSNTWRRPLSPVSGMKGSQMCNCRCQPKKPMTWPDAWRSRKACWWGNRPGPRCVPRETWRDRFPQGSSWRFCRMPATDTSVRDSGKDKRL
jgi:Pyridoxal-phosphate dependent enzyme